MLNIIVEWLKSDWDVTEIPWVSGGNYIIRGNYLDEMARGQIFYLKNASGGVIVVET